MVCHFDLERFSLRCVDALFSLNRASKDFREKHLVQRNNWFLWAFSACSLMRFQENPSATSGLGWIAFGFCWNNRVNTLVLGYRVCAWQNLPNGSCRTPNSLPEQNPNGIENTGRRRASTRRLVIILAMQPSDPAPLGATQRWVFLQGQGGKAPDHRNFQLQRETRQTDSSLF